METNKTDSTSDRAVFEQVANLKAHYEHTATEADVERVRTEIANVRTEIAKIRGESQTGIALLQTDISDLKSELTKWIIGVGIAAATLASTIASIIVNMFTS